MLAENASMKITELSNADLLRFLRATERATERTSDPDSYALSVLRRELNRRLDLVKDREAGSTGREVGDER